MSLPDPTSAETSPADVQQWLSTDPKSFTLVDCREPDEWEVCRIEGARLIPLSQFAELAPQQLSTETPIVVYCHHGMRSLRATNWLRQKGFHAWSMAGGIDAWSEAIDPEVPRY